MERINTENIKNQEVKESLNEINKTLATIEILGDIEETLKLIEQLLKIIAAIVLVAAIIFIKCKRESLQNIYRYKLHKRWYNITITI